MFNRKVIVIALSCCFFESIGKNMDDRTIGEKLGKPVSSFVEMSDFIKVQEFYYTTELSRILLVGEPRMLEHVRCLPLVNTVINPVINLVSPIFFNNRFEKFIKNGEKCSQRQLQEAIEDAIILTTYNTNAYSVSKLLDYSSEALQSKIGYIKDQIQHDSKWDQKSFSSLKKSGALAVGLTAFVVITNKYIGNNNIENKATVEFLNAIATLGLLPVSYQVLKNSYKILTTNPRASDENLGKYEELLSYVQKLKEQLKTNGFIALTLRNGNTATINNDMFNTVRFS